MRITWKESRRFNPQVVLDRIEASRQIVEDGKLVFGGFDFLEAKPVLGSMIHFPEDMDGSEKDGLISQAILGISEKLTTENVIENINQLFQISNSVHEKEYWLLSSISIEKSMAPTKLEIDGVQFSFATVYPKKFTSRLDFVSRIKGIQNPSPKEYLKVLLKVKEKVTIRAATRCLDALDYLRGIYCLLVNPGMEFHPNEWKPINKVRLGEVHTIHAAEGRIITPTYWFEPSFQEAEIPNILDREIKVVLRKVRNTLAGIEKTKYSKILKDVLVKYARALDEKDQHTALIKVWGALEALTGVVDAKYDVLIRRASFCHEDYLYHTQILEHLREHRNKSVHAGDLSDRARGDCFQVQFYLYSLIFFHIDNADYFDSFDEANSFLEMPREEKQLKRRLELTKKAVKYRQSN